MDFHDTGGAGTPVVLLHAASGHSGMWEHQLPAFTKAGYRCIAFDRSAEGFASDQLEALAQKLALAPFHVVGTAAGAIIAVDYALSHAQRLRSLVIANSIVGVQDADYLEMSRRLRPSPLGLHGYRRGRSPTSRCRTAAPSPSSSTSTRTGKSRRSSTTGTSS